MRCLNTGLIKIGITNNVTARLSNIGGKLEVLFSKNVVEPRKLESILHKQYSKYNRTNSTVNNGFTEFFQLTEQQITEIKELINDNKHYPNVMESTNAHGVSHGVVGSSPQVL